MKRINSILSVTALLFCTTVLLFGLASCSKDEITCKCTISSNMPYFSDTTTTITAEGDCSDGNSTTTAGGYTVTTNCVEI